MDAVSRRNTTGNRREQGFVIVWMAVMITTLIGMVGLAVDQANKSLIGARIQRAVDAAALAGSTYLPDNAGNMAFTTAYDVLEENGVDADDENITIEVGLGNRPNQLAVRVTEVVPTILTHVLGIGSQTVHRGAIAEHERPISLGSPLHQYGNDPHNPTDPDLYPEYWGNVFGPGSDKAKGDAIQSNRCPTPNPPTQPPHADNCAPPSGTTSWTNTDFDSEGYFYAVQVGGPGELHVDVFDPGLVHVGDRCNDQAPPNQSPPVHSYPGPNLQNAQTLTAAQIPGYPTSEGVAPSVRYARATSSPFCTGDMFYADGGSTPTHTTWVLREPDATLHDLTDNPIVCTKEFPGFVGDIRNALVNGAGPAGGEPIVNYFRRWVPICGESGLASVKQGTYFLQVMTSIKADGSPAPHGGGANRFAIRAGLGADRNTADVRVHARRMMGMYANADEANTTFHLARVLPNDASRTLVVRLFDIGDHGSATPGILRILPPVDATDEDGAIPFFEDCTWSGVGPISMKPPWPAHVATQPSCTMNNVLSSGWNGRWVEVRIPIPADYDCDMANDGCWTRINFQFPADVNDTTTWTAFIEGGSVRLIE